MDALTALVARYPACAEHDAIWGASSLRVGEHLCTVLPPEELITSVRAVVLVGNQVLVVHDPHAHHILPGGRREPGETLETTLRREVLEETGWELGAPLLLGFRHLRHLTPRPPAYRYPYPSFLHLVYATPGVAHHPEARKADDYVQGSSLKRLTEVPSLALPAGQLHFLAAAQVRLRSQAQLRP